MMAFIWLIKLLLAHLLTDFILQPASWIAQRNSKHFASYHLYLHGFITALLAWIFMGFQYPWVAITILITHTLIDGWKSYQKDKVAYFLIDQFLHLLVIFICWYNIFFTPHDIINLLSKLWVSPKVWILTTAFVFLSFPSGILIGKLTNKWRLEIAESEGLADAGKWIGILERAIILILLLKDQYQLIGLLIAAKSILRFRDTGKQEAKTEYVVIGSLISIGLSIITGILVKTMIFMIK